MTPIAWSKSSRFHRQTPAEQGVDRLYNLGRFQDRNQASQRPANPMSSIAQVDGSGTAVTIEVRGEHLADQARPVRTGVRPTQCWSPGDCCRWASPRRGSESCSSSWSSPGRLDVPPAVGRVTEAEEIPPGIPEHSKIPRASDLANLVNCHSAPAAHASGRSPERLVEDARGTGRAYRTCRARHRHTDSPRQCWGSGLGARLNGLGTFPGSGRWFSLRASDADPPVQRAKA